MTAQTYNRVTATVATSIFLILSLLLANFSNQDSPDVIQRRPSTFFTDSTGARALLLVMRRLLPSVEQWRRPLYLLPLPDQAGSASTLIVADPGRSISNREGQHLDRWLAAGGQLILLTGNGWLMAKVRLPTTSVQKKSSMARMKTARTNPKNTCRAMRRRSPGRSRENLKPVKPAARRFDPES